MFWSSSTKSRVLVVFLALAAVLMLGLVGCGEDEVSVDDVDEALDKLDEELESLDDHSIVVTGFTCPIPPDDDTGEPEAGNVFASVSVTVKNESDVEQIIGSASFYLEDEDGNRYDSDMLFDGANALGVAESLAPGSEISGVIVFQVPPDVKPKYLVEEGIVGDDVKVELPEAS
jgi:hypothetical protein